MLTALLVCTLLLIFVAAANGEPRPPLREVGYGQIAYKGHGPEWWHWQLVKTRRALRHTLRSHVPLGTRTLEAHHRSNAGSLERAFLCIHSFEGSWTDGGAPFWGGVQMDAGFQQTYGRPFYNAFGTADHWTPAMQLTVAELAYLSGRGFYPWPNTARMCGLL